MFFCNGINFVIIQMFVFLPEPIMIGLGISLPKMWLYLLGNMLTQYPFYFSRDHIVWYRAYWICVRLNPTLAI